ncbi:MAG: AzlC family ABC transporter permease [Treponemataceae bacterium]|nr:MAG: AzlC family ABC transporter permease [Treponemataceae bacterium]
MNRKTFLSIVSVTSPIFFGYIAIGVPFGLMIVKAGYPLWFAPFMGVVMYAGSGQYLAVGLFAAGASLPEMLAAQFLLNVRHCVYGLSLIDKFAPRGFWRFYAIFALSDETYALMTSNTAPKGVPSGTFCGMIAMCDHSYWILGCTLGAVLGEILPFSFAGVDFALTALFAVLLIEQVKMQKTLMPALVGLAVTTLSIVFLKSAHVLLASIALGILAITLITKIQGETKNRRKMTIEEKSPQG